MPGRCRCSLQVYPRFTLRSDSHVMLQVMPASPAGNPDVVLDAVAAECAELCGAPVGLGAGHSQRGGSGAGDLQLLGCSRQCRLRQRRPALPLSGKPLGFDVQGSGLPGAMQGARFVVVMGSEALSGMEACQVLPGGA